MLPLAWRLLSRGQRLQRRGRITDAAECFIEALDLLRWDPKHPPEPGSSLARLTALVLTARAITLTYLGDPSAGLWTLDRAERFVHPKDLGLLLHQRAFILWQNGRLNEALEWFSEAEPHLEVNGPDRFYASLFHNRALVWRDLGELHQGLTSAKRAVQLYENLNSPVHLTNARHVEALLWMDLGDVTRALAVFDELRDQYLSHAPELEGHLLNSYADAMLYVGMNRQAAEYGEEAIASFRLQGNLRAAAHREFWLAVTAFEDGRLEEGAKWARRAMDSLYEQGNEPMSFLAQLLILQGQFDSIDSSMGFADKVNRLCEALEARGWTLRLNQARILAARARIRSGDLDGVDAMLAEVQESAGYEALAESLARHLARAELAVALNEDPMPELRSGLELLDRYRMEFGSVEFQAGVSSLGIQLTSKGLIQTTNDGDPAEMLWWAERSRGQALRIPPVKSSADPDAREALGRLRQARQRVWDLQVEGEDAAEALLRVRELEEEIRDFDRMRPGPRRQAERIPPERIHEIAEARKTVVVSLFEVGGSLRAVLAGADELRHVELENLDRMAEIGRRLGADLDALGAQRLPDRLRASVEGSLRRNAAALAAGVIDPLVEFIGDRQVVIVPHSQIAWVPWPLLPPLRGRPVTVCPSAEAWCRAALRPKVTGPAVVAAGRALKAVHEEVSTIADLYPDAQLIEADDSDPELVLKAIDGASVAHLAAHGHHEPDNVLFSRLDFRHGPLNAYELLGLDQPPGHVVLSSCDLGRSTVAVGNETLGFTAALLHAGTSTVVSSLGRVPDDLAAEMMIEYHRRCAAGATPAEALAAVGEHRPWHPFVVFGA